MASNYSENRGSITQAFDENVTCNVKRQVRAYKQVKKINEKCQE
jgi:hypothetical protein